MSSNRGAPLDWCSFCSNFHHRNVLCKAKHVQQELEKERDEWKRKCESIRAISYQLVTDNETLRASLRLIVESFNSILTPEQIQTISDALPDTLRFKLEVTGLSFSQLVNGKVGVVDVGIARLDSIKESVSPKE